MIFLKKSITQKAPYLKYIPGLLFLIFLAVQVAGYSYLLEFIGTYGRATSFSLSITENAEVAFAIGNYFFNGGGYDLARAEQAYRRAVEIDPKIFRGHYQLARIYFVRGSFPEALKEINEELDVNPDNLRSLYIRGLIYGYRNHPGDLERAEEDFRRFTEWAPTEWAGHNDLAWVLLKQKKYKEAIGALETAFEKISATEINPWLWNNKGLAELNLRMKDEAVRSLKMAVGAADKLSEFGWKRAYPGNDPRSVERGLSTFKKTLQRNLQLAENL